MITVGMMDMLLPREKGFVVDGYLLCRRMGESDELLTVDDMLDLGWQIEIYGYPHMRDEMERITVIEDKLIAEAQAMCPPLTTKQRVMSMLERTVNWLRHKFDPNYGEEVQHVRA